jgi:predicted aconitase with swiveling domain
MGSLIESWQAEVLLPGTAVAAALVLKEPLSLWGGLSPETGEIIDRRHPNSGQIVTARILLLPAGRGSSSASSILLEALRLGTAPAAIITLEMDGILALGAAVAHEMYDNAPAILVLPAQAYHQIQTGDVLQIASDGRVSKLQP